MPLTQPVNRILKVARVSSWSESSAVPEESEV